MIRLERMSNIFPDARSTTPDGHTRSTGSPVTSNNFSNTSWPVAVTTALYVLALGAIAAIPLSKGEGGIVRSPFSNTASYHDLSAGGMVLKSRTEAFRCTRGANTDTLSFIRRSNSFLSYPSRVPRYGCIPVNSWNVTTPHVNQSLFFVNPLVCQSRMDGITTVAPNFPIAHESTSIVRGSGPFFTRVCAIQFNSFPSTMTAPLLCANETVSRMRSTSVDACAMSKDSLCQNALVNTRGSGSPSAYGM